MSKGYQAYADALTQSEPSGENAAVLRHIGLSAQNRAPYQSPIT
ncbi:MAG: hypothetical protein CM15mP74_11340 [Halieaceae bacterium]|nr:MAG: hypothetical protein CM15mP74_11340 [Halieaceae bacterium]